MASELDLASLAVRIHRASAQFDINSTLQTSVAEWLVSAELAEDVDSAQIFFDKLVSEGYLVPSEGASASKKSKKALRSSGKRQTAAAEDGSQLDSSTASSASSVSVTVPTYTWNMSLIEKVLASVPEVETIEGEQPAESMKRRSRSKRKNVVTEGASVEVDGAESVTEEESGQNAEEERTETSAKFEMAMLPPVRNHRAPSVLVNPMDTIRSRSTVAPISEDRADDSSGEEITEDHLDDTIDILSKYLQSLAPELRKKLNSADYSILLSSLVRMCQDELGWSDKMVFDVGNLKTKSLSQLNKSIDLNVNLLMSQMNRMSKEKGIDTKRTIVKTLRNMKKILEAPLLQERIELNPGEEIEWKVDGVINLDALDEDEEEVGRLVFTNYRCMYFGPNAKTSESRGAEPDISIPLACISTINKLGDKKISSKTKRLEIITKDQRIIRWGFKSGSHRRKEISAWFKAYIANMPNNLFCFQVFHAIGISESPSSSSSSTTNNTPASTTAASAPNAVSAETAGSGSPGVPPKGKSTKSGSREDGLKASKSTKAEKGETVEENKRSRGLNTSDPSRVEFDGWDFYDPHTEFHRQGVSSDPKWTYTNANVDYGLCDTYPTAIWVPTAFSSENLATAASFRSRNRLPVLAYYYRANGATLTRCSQPAVGVSRKRSKEDELLLGEIGRANNGTDRLPIFDARPKANAVANTAMGYGYELIQHYPNCSLTFCDIENIHVMRGSLTKMRDAVHKASSPESHKFHEEVDSSGWLTHQAILISSALRIVDLVHEQDTSVLIHCSDGWDRTAQLISLSCLMLDPYYRTLNGFATLVEKDWLSFGHRFSLRHAYDGTSSGDRAPIFHQFLETVWQFWRQKPMLFEFNETFLVTLLDEVYNAYYGTFIYDSQKERVEANLPTTTISVWTSLLSASNRNKFTNPLYTPVQDVVLMSASAQTLAVWEQYYYRFQPRLVLPPSLDALLALAIARNGGRNGTVGSTSAISADFPVTNAPVANKNGSANNRSLLLSSAPGKSGSPSPRATSLDPGASSPVGAMKKPKAPYKRSRNTDPEK